MQNNYPEPQGMLQMPQQAPQEQGMLSQPQPDAQMKQQALQLVSQVMQQPSPQTIEALVAFLESQNNEGADQLADAIEQSANNPQQLQQLLQQVAQKLSQ